MPKYVWLKSSDGKYKTALEHTGGMQYFRVGGEWSLTAARVGDKLTVSQNEIHEHLRGLSLVECSRAEWKKDNGRYAE